jgi:mono/diheme cytochrome c family protein
MKHPSYRKSRVARAAMFAVAFAFSAGPSASAAPGDPAQGDKLAKRWCAACHVVAADQARGADNVPAFVTIAKMKGLNAESIAQFLMDPHPKMPDMQLSRDEARDLGAYIASLGR